MSNKLILAAVFVSCFSAGLVAQASKWVAGSNGKIAGGLTLIGGKENGKDLFLCAASKAGTYHPGKIVGNNCNFGYGGKEITEPSYFTLSVTRDSIKKFSWHNAANGDVPRVANHVPIEVGREGTRILYVCRAEHNGGTHPGKIVGNNCNIGWGGAEVTVSNYQVLLFNTK